MKFYRLLPHTADLRMEIRGESLKALFGNAARALFSYLTDRRKIKKSREKIIKVSGDNKEQLLVNWLNELIYLFEEHQMVFTDFKIEEFHPNRLTAKAWGEDFLPKKHIIKGEPKAATYHLLKISRGKGGYLTRVVFDL